MSFPSDLSQISPPSSSEAVYKDDCMFSFDTAFDPQGIDICLTCFQAFSRGKYNYTAQHAEIYDHDIFLNYKRTLKPKGADEIQPQKMVKLEIKEQTEDDLFLTKAAIYVASTDSTTEFPGGGIPQRIRVAAEGVLKATSREKRQQIKSWEQSILVCPHSKEIKQTPSNASIHECADCGLTENLWLCLECGNVGCGRQQFGGVPGNSHAVAHHKQHPDHHVAVKLGSLSSESADCYCYTCDDDVKVPKLADYLKTYGIDLSNFVKTEKNLTELQIEQNIQWDFNMDGENGETLSPVFGPGLSGFKNLGNSCYLASVLQVMFSVPSFQMAYFSADEGMPIEKVVGNIDPAADLETQMFKIGDGLLSGRYSVPDPFTTEKIKYQRGIRPSGFKELIGKGHPEFSTMQQQDAFEFWMYLVEQLEKGSVSGQADSVPTEVFKYVLGDKLKCSVCGGVRLSKELVDNVTLPVEEKLLDSGVDGTKDYAPTTMEDCFTKWHAAEQIEYDCPQCHSHVAAFKRQGFRSFPSYLVVSPQRIKLENWVPVKLPVPITFSQTIDLLPYKAEGKLPGESELPDDSSSNEFKYNAEALDALLVMGFPENRCKRALYTTGNGTAETAANWLFEHMDDAGIDEPFTPKNNSTKPEAKAEDIESLVSMGFSAKLANKALVLNENSVEQSVEWLFGHPDDNGELPENEADGNPEANIEKLEKEHTTGKYTLLGVVCHKGTSIHSGHYVAFVKKLINGQEKWILFNDEKVVLAGEESLKEIEVSGYLYVYKRNE
ncbi:DEKNAAC102449 [Brettanomyces naardenensis]|uniref:Ubiquitin carboxyl-terminal hydrolase n=1 Tax=Brettanomyces naardenensis TaxID=13370 RepID=A0A448YKW3_BRENA|nr:DEKNAAC102449 [Brettanomyces naardenensis]